VWNNAVDNITSMQIISDTGEIDIGSRIIILKANNFTGGMPTGVITTPYIKGTFVRVGSQELSGTASSVTFSGLNGDNDVVYYLTAFVKGALAQGNYALVQINGATTNYIQQSLNCNSTTVSASRAAQAGYPISYTTTSSNYGCGNMLIYAKTGFPRLAISNIALEVSGTTVMYLRTNGCAYTVTDTNVTSLVVNGEASNGFGAGSRFDLYALRPNG
jgi:hypothetical protein